MADHPEHPSGVVPVNVPGWGYRVPGHKQRLRPKARHESARPAGGPWLSTSEAAARLGIQYSTFVSRSMANFRSALKRCLHVGFGREAKNYYLEADVERVRVVMDRKGLPPTQAVKAMRLLDVEQ